MSYIMCCIDPLNTMYRVDSEQSMGDSDENIMEHLTEGGVTIMKTLDRKRQVQFFYVRVLLNIKCTLYV